MQHILPDTHLWVDLYADDLYAYALKFIRQPDIAENLVQETFIAALNGKSNFKGSANPKTWMIGILKNKITDHLRTKYREIPVSQLTNDNVTPDDFFDAVDGHLKQPPGNWHFPASASLTTAEFWQAFQSCLDKLPAITAQAFALKEIDERDTKEICKVLNVSSTNLWVMLHRARLQLRQCLETNWFNNHD